MHRYESLIEVGQDGSPDRTPVAAKARSGFTLFEVAISLLIMTIAVISCLLIFPIGIKAQQLARMKLLAAAKAQEMVSVFATANTSNPSIDVEATNPWDSPVAYKAMAWDLEARLSSSKFGIMPLPLRIAQRIDSDGDEIQNILDRGGYIYYSQPNATAGLDSNSLQPAPANENQRLVFAVEGYPQHNCLPIFPWKAWGSYVQMYPGPPMHGEAPPTAPDNLAYADNWGDPLEYMYEGTQDPDMVPVCVAFENFESQMYSNYAGGGYWNTPGRTAAWRTAYLGGLRNAAMIYLQTTLWYCQKKGLPATFYDPTPAANAAIQQNYAGRGVLAVNPTATPSNFQYTPLTDFLATGTTPADQVNAMRLLAHAAMCQTAFYNLTALGGQPSIVPPAAPGPGPAAPAISWVQVPALASGTSLIPGAPWTPCTSLNNMDGPAIPTMPAPGSPGLNLTHDKIVWYEESCMNLVMKFSARYPYDWGAPRPITRAIMSDQPLIELDMFPDATYPQLSGFIGGTGSPGVAATQWRPISALPVKNIGSSWSFPTVQVPDNTGPGTTVWGNQQHFTLTAPFNPSDRCRQLVFWSVDWQSFEDFETAPSAPVDASKYPIAAPMAGYPFSGAPNTQNRMTSLSFHDESMFSFRNPEKTLLFLQDMSGTATGFDMTPGTNQPPGPYIEGDARGVVPYFNQDRGDAVHTNYGFSAVTGQQTAVGVPATVNPLYVFSGMYGADRNFNYHLDRGPLPTSARVRAVLVGRYNFYDGRVQGPLR